MSNKRYAVRGKTAYPISQSFFLKLYVTPPFNRGDGPDETWQSDFKARRDKNWFVSREACERHILRVLGDSDVKGEFE